MELANTLTQYATQASYPTKLRSSITKETADIIIEHAMRVVDLMGIYAPSKTYQVRFGDKNRKSRRHGFWHRR